MFENIDAAGWMTIGGCLLLGFCVVYFIMDKLSRIAVMEPAMFGVMEPVQVV